MDLLDQLNTQGGRLREEVAAGYFLQLVRGPPACLHRTAGCLADALAGWLSLAVRAGCKLALAETRM